MELMKRIEDKFGAKSRKTARGKEMHVSDLTGCPLKPYNRLIGVERKITKSSIGLMVFGIVAENILGWTFPSEQLQFQSNFWLLESEENIFGHIDIYEDYKFPLEVKASRKSIFKSADLPTYWVEQLMSYMAMQGANIGWLIIFNVFTTQIMAFRIVMTDEDILGWLITLVMRASEIRMAADKKDPHKLKIHPDEYEWCNYKHSCCARAECQAKYKRIKAEKRKAKAEKRKRKL